MWRYLIVNAAKDICREAFLSVVLAVIAFISVSASLNAGSIVWGLWRSYTLSESPDAQELAVAEFFMKDTADQSMLREKAFESLLSGLLQNMPEKLGFCGFMDMVVEWDDEIKVCCVQGNSEGLSELQRYDSIDGSGIEELYQEDEVCILRDGGHLAANGISVGETLLIQGEAFKVIGIAEYPSAYGDVLISYDNLVDLAGAQKYQFQVLLKYGESPEISRIRASFASIFDISQLCTGIEYQEIHRDSVIQRSIERLWAVAVLFVMAGINFWIMLKGKIFLEQKRIGIRMAIGASEKEILAENEMRTCFIIVLSFGCAQLFNAVFSLYLRKMGIRQTAGVSICVLIIYCMLGKVLEDCLLKRLLRRNKGFSLLRG